jgi:hypothetical protein
LPPGRQCAPFYLLVRPERVAPASEHQSTVLDSDHDAMSYTSHLLLRDPPKRSHQLRYVLRNRATRDVYLVILFTIHRKENVNEDGTLKELPTSDKPSVPEDYEHGEHDAGHDEEAALAEARKHLGPTHPERAQVETSLDDVD